MTKMGAPTKYKSEYSEICRKLALLGKTDVQMAEILGVTDRTFYNWKNQYPEFFQAINNGKHFADAEVAASLYERALGYSHKEQRVFNEGGKPKIVEVVKEYPPDTAAAFIWLKNRAGWSDNAPSKDPDTLPEEEYTLPIDEKPPEDAIL